MNPLLISKKRGIMVGAALVQSGQTVTLSQAEANTINYGVLAGFGAGIVATVIAMKVWR